jgi:hypothetical protein
VLEAEGGPSHASDSRRAVRERLAPPADSLTLWRQVPIGRGAAEKPTNGRAVLVRPCYSLRDVLKAAVEI